jgi:hypothetical protein
VKKVWGRWLIEGGAVLVAAALMYRLAFPAPANAPIAKRATPPPAPPATASLAPPPPPAQPGATAPPAGLVLQGSGEGASEPIFLTPGLVLFHIQHAQASPFAMFLLNDSDEHLALLANASTPISGTQAYGIRTAGSYYLHVISGDAWSVRTAAVAAAAPAPFTGLAGSGMLVSPPLAFSAGAHSFQWSHAGRLGFMVVLWSADGSQRLEIANANGAASGASSIAVPAAGAYVLMVMADGEWTVSAEP